MTRSLVGLDIGTSGVRAAEFTVGRRAPVLRRFATAPLPPGSVRSGKVAEPEALTEALDRLWSEGKLQGRSVVLGVANDSVLVRQLDLDWMPPDDFRKALRFQVAESLPLPVDEANLDYYLLDELEEPPTDPASGEARRVARVMLVAAGREMIDGFVQPVQAAGLRVVRADLVPFALVRAAAPVTEGAETAEAVVDVGAETMAVVVHVGGRPRFVRMISGIGGETITRALQQKYGWEWADAERTKVVLGLGGEDPEAASSSHSTSTDAGAAHPARAVIHEQAQALVAEIRATLSFYRGSAGASPLTRVLLAGNGSRISGLAGLLSDQIGVPVESLSVLDRVEVNRRLELDAHQRALLTVPAGLCLGVPA